MLKVILKQSNKIILYSKDQSKVLGRFPFGPGNKYKNERTAREAAKKRERQIQYFKQRGKAGGFKMRRRKSFKVVSMVSVGEKVVAAAKIHFRRSNDLYGLVNLMENVKRDSDNARTTRQINRYISEVEKAIASSKEAGKVLMRVGKKMKES